MRISCKSMKKGLAAFLSVCMVTGSIQIGGQSSTALGAESNEADLLSFDQGKLRAAAEAAVDSTKMVQPPAVVATASNAAVSGFEQISFELADAQQLLTEGTAVPTDTQLRIFLSPQWEGFDDESGSYRLTGNEELIFMLENRGSEKKGYQLLFGDNITDIIEVESKRELLKEYKAFEEEEDAQKSAADLTPAGAGEAGGTESSGQSTAGSGQSAGTESTVTEASGGESTGEETGEAGGESAGEEKGPAEEETSDGTEQESGEAEDSESSGASGEAEAEPDEVGNESEGALDNDGSENEDMPDTAGTENGDAADDDGEAGEDAGDSEISIIGSVLDMLTGTITARAEERAATASTAEKATDSVVTIATSSEAQKNITFTGPLDGQGYTKLEHLRLSANLLIYKDIKTVDLAAENEPAAIALFSMDLTESEEETPKASNTSAVAFYGVRLGDVITPAATAIEKQQIVVDLYDYSGTGKSNTAINAYVSQEGVEDSRGNVFQFNTGGPNESAINRYWLQEGARAQNIYQGILDDVSGVTDTLYPESDDIISVRQGTAIKPYRNTDATELFAFDKNTGNYSYDSSEKGASYQSRTRTLETASGTEFWPFGASDWFFGMSMRFDFYKPENGRYLGQPMIFNFSGDDDVWVFLTNKATGERELVLDIGGNHGRMDGSLNFSTGEVIYSNENANDVQRSGVVVYGKDRECEWKGSGSSRYTTYTSSVDEELLTEESGEYTLEFYYLERGGNNSNCKIEFNLPVMPSNGITLEKKLTGPEGTAETYKDALFGFRIVYAEEEYKDELIGYYNGTPGTSSEHINLRNVSITGSGVASISDILEQDRTYCFYVEETGEEKGKSIRWSSSAEIVPVEGLQNRDAFSPVYRAEAGSSSYSVSCENVYGDFEPEIAKRAWKNWASDEGAYDITLEVTGAERTSTSGSTGSQALNVVFAIDKSGSMEGWHNYLDDVIAAINTYIEKMPEGSYVSAVAFSDDGLSGKNKPYYGESGDQRYYSTLLRWQPAKAASLDNGAVEADGGTHSAAGFLGAYHMLNPDTMQGIPSENIPCVIYLTDGVPTYGLEKGNGGATVVGDGNDSSKRTREAATYMLTKLRDERNVPVYAIAYRINKDAGSMAWLKNGVGASNIYNASSEDADSLIHVLAQIQSSVTVKESIEDPVVTDVVAAENVSLTGSIKKQGNTTVAIPELYLKLGTVSGSSEEGSGELPKEISADEKGTRLLAEWADSSWQIVQYREEENGPVLASYHTQEHTITWYAGRNQETTEEEDRGSIGNITKTLTYGVQAVAKDTEGSDRAEDDTGTHSGETGYYSNEQAKLTTSNAGEKTFPHPVVKMPTASLTIDKEVAGIADGDEKGTYAFTLKIGDGAEAASVSGGSGDAEFEKGEYTFRLTGAGEETGTIIFAGIPVGTEYVITETGIVPGSEVSDTYYLSNIEIKKDSSTLAQTASGEAKAAYPLSADSVIAAGSNEIAVINTYSEYQYITIEKRLAGGGAYPPEDTAFIFRISGGSIDERIEILAGESSRIKIPPEDREQEFTIRETDTQGAWNTQSGIKAGDEVSVTGREEITAKAGQTVVFQNEYYQHHIELSKKLREPENPAEEAEYRFDVRLKVMPGAELVKEDIRLNLAEVSVDEFGASADPDYDYQCYVMLPAGQTVVIQDLPKAVTAYEIRENVSETAHMNPDYQAEFDSLRVQKGDEAAETKTDETTGKIDFPPDAGRTDQIIFTNKLSHAEGKMQIIKALVDSSGNPAEAEEDLVFTFRVTDADEKIFFVSVQVNRGESEGSEVVTVPTGTYTVEELPALRYQPTTEEPETLMVGTEEVATATFCNYKSSDGYFSDTSTKINKAEKDGFQPAFPAARITDRRRKRR